MNVFENYQLKSMKVVLYIKISMVCFVIFCRLQKFGEFNEKYKSSPQVKETLILKNKTQNFSYNFKRLVDSINLI